MQRDFARILAQPAMGDSLVPDWVIVELVDAAMGAVDVLIDEATSTNAWDNLTNTEKARAILAWNRDRKTNERQGYPW